MSCFSVKARTALQSRLLASRAERRPQLRNVAAGIDPQLVKEVVGELQEEEVEGSNPPAPTAKALVQGLFQFPQSVEKPAGSADRVD
jgi:hypothetical protein